MGEAGSGTKSKRIIVTCPQCRTEYHTELNSDSINEIHKCINCQARFKLRNQTNAADNNTPKYKPKTEKQFMRGLKESLLKRLSFFRIGKRKKIEVNCPSCSKKLDLPYSKNAFAKIHSCSHCGAKFKLKSDSKKNGTTQQSKYSRINEDLKQQQSSNIYNSTMNVDCPNCRRTLSIAKTDDIYSKVHLCPVCKFNFTITNRQSNQNTQGTNTQYQQQRNTSVDLREFIELLESARKNLNIGSAEQTSF